jgi:hypothetical protein
MFNKTFGRGSLKDYCPISIVKEEADCEYTSGVLVQGIYSLYLNNTRSIPNYLSVVIGTQILRNL